MFGLARGVLSVLATVVDTSALAKVVVASLVGAIGVTIAVSLAILSVTRFDELRRDERTVEASGFAVIAAVATAASLAAVVYGIVIMISK